MRSSRSAANDGGARQSVSSVPEDYGEGWQQLTDHGKIYLSKKEKNVFILEGTKAAGFSGCSFHGNVEQQSYVENAAFTLTVELKVVPNESCPDQQVYILVDCRSMSDLSSGCDFTGVKLTFDNRELRVESHRRNATAQTHFVQPNCSLLRAGGYVTAVAVVQGDTFSVSLGGVSIVSNIPLNRPRTEGITTSVGCAVYGRTRCYIRRFRLTAAAAPAGTSTGPSNLPSGQAASASSSQAAAASGDAAGESFAPLQRGSTRRSTSAAPAGGGELSFASNAFPGASEDLELASTIERDVVVTDLTVKFDDIGGLESAKRAMNEAVLLPLILPDLFTGLRKPWRGVLLFGPPGTGKTMLAKAVAASADNVTFFNCSAATLTSKWRGESEKLLRALFLTARARVPSILFFDEIDSLLSQRGLSSEHEASRRFKSEFLIHMDGLLTDARSEEEAGSHLLVLATSNAPWDLDEALRRRLEKRIYIPLPDYEARLQMLQHHLKAINTAEDLDLPELARRTEGYSGADIHTLCRDAAMSPLRRLVEGLSATELLAMKAEGKLTSTSIPVEMPDLEAALESVLPTVATGDTKKYVEWAKEFGSK